MSYSFEAYKSFFQQLTSQGGPKPEQDLELTEIFNHLYEDFQAGRISSEQLACLQKTVNFTLETMQGFAFLKPNGYAGCFEIIDRIYKCHHTENPRLYNWDRYFQSCWAPQAVRNRKDYFISLICSLLEKDSPLSILNVASGPCRDVLELFKKEKNSVITMHCVDQDSKAINYAKNLCETYKSNLVFHERNALLFKPQQKFNLVWAAGLFDYLHDDLFIALTKRLIKYAAPDGQIVIGNFSDKNPTRAYMEFMDWMLYHRSANDLSNLAVQAGLTLDQISIHSEPLGVNLFLHINKRA